MKHPGPAKNYKKQDHFFTNIASSESRFGNPRLIVDQVVIGDGYMPM